MKTGDRVISYIDYGSIKFDLRPMLKKRNISENQLMKQAGIHNQVFDRYIKGEITRTDMDVLARLCYVLDCELNDIMFYDKPKKL